MSHRRVWDEAVAHATYLRNRAPTRALKGMSPYEAWNEKKPDISHLREFGCDVWVLDESQNKTKLSPKSKKMVFFGFMDGSKSMRYYDPSTRKIKVSCDVAFKNNEEPRELEIMADIPGLPVEGEIGINSPAQTAPETPTQPLETQIEPTQEEESEDEPTSEKRELRTRTKNVDYKLAGNSQARIPGARKAPTKPTPLRYTPTPSPAPDVT